MNEKENRSVLKPILEQQKNMAKIISSSISEESILASTQAFAKLNKAILPLSVNISKALAGTDLSGVTAAALQLNKMSGIVGEGGAAKNSIAVSKLAETFGNIDLSPLSVTMKSITATLNSIDFTAIAQATSQISRSYEQSENFVELNYTEENFQEAKKIVEDLISEPENLTNEQKIAQWFSELKKKHPVIVPIIIFILGLYISQTADPTITNFNQKVIDTGKNVVRKVETMIDKNLLDLIKNSDVEYKQLSEVSTLIRGNGLKKANFVETGKPVIHYGQIYTYYSSFTDKVISYVKPELFDKLVKVEPGDVIITNTSENLKDVGTAVGWLGNEEIGTGGHATVVKPSEELLGKFFVYWTKTDDFAKQKRKFAKGTKVIDVSAKDLAKFTIPIPSLEIQQKVVEILDKMTDYVAELTVELTLRQKQNAYYRDQLLTLPDGGEIGVRWMMLGEVAENLDAKRKPITKAKRQAGKYPYYGASGIVDYVEDYIFDGDYLLISEDGANLLARSTPIAFSASGRFWVNNHAHIIKFDNYATRKFVEYYFSNIDISQYISTAAQPKLTKENLNKIKIPLPPLHLQSKIVEILDRFDKLTSDLTEGLPREIELRQKQYEYWREQLLSFKRE